MLTLTAVSSPNLCRMRELMRNGGEIYFVESFKIFQIKGHSISGLLWVYFYFCMHAKLVFYL